MSEQYKLKENEIIASKNGCDMFQLIRTSCYPRHRCIECCFWGNVESCTPKLNKHFGESRCSKFAPNGFVFKRIEGGV